MKNLTKNQIQSVFNRIKFPVILLAFLIFALGFNSCINRARGEYSNLRCETGMGIVNGEADFGINLKVNVKNIGEGGNIKISATLSTSEGEWSREQNLAFKKGESRELTYFFDKPTINVDVKGMQCRASVSPSVR